jgi:hypothetical protein
MQRPSSRLIVQHSLVQQFKRYVMSLLDCRFTRQLTILVIR